MFLLLRETDKTHSETHHRLHWLDNVNVTRLNGFVVTFNGDIFTADEVRVPVWNFDFYGLGFELVVANIFKAGDGVNLGADCDLEFYYRYLPPAISLIIVSFIASAAFT